ncbi:ribosomal protein S5 domain 2-type protein [Pelagophyceae sp. CCMP2097]|nr:ribosomal protein S5 domain 2-type protein [Pelagophyceae sp. CCMP2097]|mmetsp:Transcript_3950/g.12161  ORF Transcript_3950/g.12161 Transcript_3950/m.12161 type:complete len:267 (+) Transcript_3950:42-842(+)
MGSRKRGSEWLSLTGLREDGRRLGELRSMKVEVGCARARGADGSAWLEMGQTKVVAYVVGPQEPRRRGDERHDRASLDVTVRMAPFAGLQRRTVRPNDRRHLELADSLKRTLEAAVMTHMYPRTQISIVVHVLADDGARIACCINAASLALVDAGISMLDTVSAASCGILGDAAEVACDLTRAEEAGANDGNQPPLLHVAIMPQSGRVLLAQLAGAQLGLLDFEKLLRSTVATAVDASRQLSDVSRHRAAQATRIRRATMCAEPKK